MTSPEKYQLLPAMLRRHPPRIKVIDGIPFETFSLMSREKLNGSLGVKDIFCMMSRPPKCFSELSEHAQTICSVGNPPRRVSIRLECVDRMDEFLLGAGNHTRAA
jgi:hypothetical protein